MKYKDYFNFELGNRDIYSHNDILGMTVQDLFDQELPLSYQYNTIGIPKDDELKASPNTHQYTNANGKLRWRSSSKTTEELLEEERQRRLAQEAQMQMTQSQLGAMSEPAAPIQNVPEVEELPMTDDLSEPDSFQNALSNLRDSYVDRINSGESFLPWNKKGKKQPEDTYDDSPYPDYVPTEDEQTQEAGDVEQVDIEPVAEDEQEPNYLEENSPEESMTGGAAPLKDDDYKKVLEGGIEKYYGLPDGYLDGLKNMFEQGVDKNNNMNLWEEIQGFLYEKALNKKYPMASNATIDGMHDFEAAKKQKNVRVYNDMNAIDNTNYKSYLKTLGANDKTPGVVYDEHSDVSINMSNSPEMEAYLASIRDKVIKGQPLGKYHDFNYDASFEDVKAGHDDKVSRMATFRNVRAYDPHVDENGIFTCKLVDYSDFKNEPIKRLQDLPNKWGHDMSKKRLYKNYYQVVYIRKKIKW